MKKIIFLLCVACPTAFGQVFPWQPGQPLTASALNAALAARTTHTSGPLTLGSVIVGNGSSDSAALTSNGTTGQLLTSAGSGVPPVWATFSGTNPMTTAGDIIIGGTAGVETRLAAGANNTVMTISAGSPVWSAAINATSIGATTRSTGDFTTLTATTPIAVTSGGTGCSSASGTCVDNISGFSSTGFLVRTGTGTYSLQSATNGVSLGNLAQVANNTVLANATSGTANIAEFAMPSCSTSGSALNWTTNSGFTCNTTITATNQSGGTVAATTISASGQITSTLATGTAPLSVSSTTPVTNLSIGGNAATATTATNQSGGTVAATTLSASSTVSGAGFSTYLASPPAIGGTVAAAISASTLSSSNTTTFSPANANVTISPTGTGTVTISPAGALTVNPTAASTINNTSIGVTTPLAVKGTTIVATSTITPSTTSGIVGTTLADNAQAGSVGEFPSPTNLTSVALTTSTNANVSSISLTAGDWDVWGVISFNPAGTTTTQFEIGGISTTSATLGALGTYFQYQTAVAAGLGQILIAPTQRINVSTTTTVYLVAQMGFSVSTATANGYLSARRRR